MCDNVTVTSYINIMDGAKSITCNNIANEIWKFAIKNKFWIFVAHIPGKNNTDADGKSKISNDATEWKLFTENFESIIKKFVEPYIDFLLQE